jgi:hypothetical protein
MTQNHVRLLAYCDLHAQARVKYQENKEERKHQKTSDPKLKLKKSLFPESCVPNILALLGNSITKTVPKCPQTD